MPAHGQFLAEAEVGDHGLDPAMCVGHGEENVVRLQVSVNNVEGVQVGQARGGLLQQGDGLQAEVGKVLLLHVLLQSGCTQLNGNVLELPVPLSAEVTDHVRVLV